MMNKSKRNFWLDEAILIAFLITATTGFVLWRVIPNKLGISILGLSRSVWITFHISSGIVSLAGVVLHVAWHWNWLKSLRGRPLSGISEKLRANRIVDRVMWITYIATNVSGALAWAMHFGNGSYVVTVPDRLHMVVGLAWIFLVTAHLALHRKWIVSTTQRYIRINSN